MGLHLKGELQVGCLLFYDLVVLEGTRPQMSKHQNTKDKKTQLRPMTCSVLPIMTSVGRTQGMRTTLNSRSFFKSPIYL